MFYTNCDDKDNIYQRISTRQKQMYKNSGREKERGREDKKKIFKIKKHVLSLWKRKTKTQRLKCFTVS